MLRFSKAAQYYRWGERFVAKRCWERETMAGLDKKPAGGAVRLLFK
jgi:hypothetical protein